jgi:hypothetical protein
MDLRNASHFENSEKKGGIRKNSLAKMEIRIRMRAFLFL